MAPRASAEGATACNCESNARLFADENHDIPVLLIEDEVQHVGELSDEILQRFDVTCRICHGNSPLHGQAQSRPNVGSLTGLSGER